MAGAIPQPPPASGQSPPLRVAPLPRIHRGWRVFIFYSCALLLTGLVSMLFADLLWRTGWSASRTLLLILFAILFLPIAIGCMHGLYGFFIRIFGTRRRITALKPYKDQNIDGVSTAIIFPVYNEDSLRVLEGLRATYESLQRAGHLDRFDFFILSDSTNPDRWIEEERRWSELVCDLDALGKIYYRRRLFNEERKSGNVRDFLNTWGKRYRYFVCCDADSVMRRGLPMARRMKPKTPCIQPMAISRNRTANRTNNTVRDADQPVRQSRSANNIETSPVNSKAQE